MLEIPAGIISPVFMRDPITVTAEGKVLHGVDSYRITDLATAKALCKQRVAHQCGTARRKLIDVTGKKSKPELPVYEMKRDSGGLTTMTGESASMRPSRPCRGAISGSGYAKRLEGFAYKNKEAVRLFNSWKTKRTKNEEVSPELIKLAHQGSILYMPNAGPLTAKPKPDGRKRTGPRPARSKVRGNNKDGWQVSDGNGNWETRTVGDIRQLFSAGRAKLVSDQLA